MAIVQRGKRFYVVVRVSGKQKWVAAGTSKRNAQQVEAEMKASVGRGEYRVLKKATFKEFKQVWWDDYVLMRPLKQGTQDEYTVYLRKHLLPFFGHIQLRAITPSLIQRYITMKLQSGLSAKSVRNHLVTLSSILSHAVKWDYLSDNPLRRVDKPKLTPSAAAYLPVDSVKRLLQAAAEPWKTVFLMAVLTGMRLGEILGLTWGAVDFEAQTLSVRHSLYKGQLGTPKNESSIRCLPLTPLLLAGLMERKVAAPASPLDLVFCRDDGAPLSPKSVTTALHRALEAASLPMVRFHDLRHTVASTLLQNGENPKVVQELLGHADGSKTMMDVYAHVFDKDKVEAVNKLEAQFLGHKGDLS